jgi:hypothetical protein
VAGEAAPEQVLEQLRRKELRWWAVAGRLEAARSLATDWVRAAGTAGWGAPPWPRPHGVADLLIVLLVDVRRAGVDPGGKAWDAARSAWSL